MVTLKLVVQSFIGCHGREDRRKEGTEYEEEDVSS
jgi:hypothetical protein